MNVKECMNTNVCYCTPGTKISEVAKLMKMNHIGCIPVCNDSKEVVGLVTDRDIILRSVACDKDANTTPVSDIMTCNVCCCDCNNDVTEATNLMSELQVRRIPIVEENKIIGILTLGDIVNETKVGNKQTEETFGHICNCSHNPKNAE